MFQMLSHSSDPPGDPGVVPFSRLLRTQSDYLSSNCALALPDLPTMEI